MKTGDKQCGSGWVDTLPPRSTKQTLSNDLNCTTCGASWVNIWLGVIACCLVVTTMFQVVAEVRFHKARAALQKQLENEKPSFPFEDEGL